MIREINMGLDEFHDSVRRVGKRQTLINMIEKSEIPCARDVNGAITGLLDGFSMSGISFDDFRMVAYIKVT